MRTEEERKIQKQSLLNERKSENVCTLILAVTMPVNF